MFDWHQDDICLFLLARFWTSSFDDWPSFIWILSFDDWLTIEWPSQLLTSSDPHQTLFGIQHILTFFLRTELSGREDRRRLTTPMKSSDRGCQRWLTFTFRWLTNPANLTNSPSIAGPNLANTKLCSHLSCLAWVRMVCQFQVSAMPFFNLFFFSFFSSQSGCPTDQCWSKSQLWIHQKHSIQGPSQLWTGLIRSWMSLTNHDTIVGLAGPSELRTEEASGPGDSSTSPQTWSSTPAKLPDRWFLESLRQRTMDFAAGPTRQRWLPQHAGRVLGCLIYSESKRRPPSACAWRLCWSPCRCGCRTPGQSAAWPLLRTPFPSTLIQLGQPLSGTSGAAHFWDPCSTRRHCNSLPVHGLWQGSCPSPSSTTTDWLLSIPAHYQKPQLPWCHSVRPWIDTHKWRKWLNWMTHLTRMTFQPLSHRDSRVDSFNSFNSNSTGWTWLIILKSKQVKCQDCQSPTLPSLSFIEAGVAPVIV